MDSALKFILKSILKILMTLILMPIYWIVSILVMIINAIGSVVLAVGGLLSFIVILVTLIDMISTGNVKGDIPQLVLGALLVVVPSIILGTVETVHDAFGKALEFVAGI
jgi:hypothetical protein